MATNECGRSSLSYPGLYKTNNDIPDANFNFVACGGATTGTVRHDQLGALSKQTDLVTITIGGNDIGFSPLLTACSLPGDDTACNAQVARSEALSVFVLPALLASTYHAIRQQAPHATVVVLGYPRLFELTSDAACGDPFAPTLARRIKLNHAADILDGVIKTTSRLFGFRFADVRAAFSAAPGHGLCAAPKDAWINGPEVTNEGYHPTATGYSNGYLPALNSAVGPRGWR